MLAMRILSSLAYVAASTTQLQDLSATCHPPEKRRDTQPALACRSPDHKSRRSAANVRSPRAKRE
jgi:hypothetical protein